MKKTIYLTLGLALSLVAFPSCDDKEFLTEKPKTIYVKENAFEKASQIDAALVKTYNKFHTLNMIRNQYRGSGIQWWVGDTQRVSMTIRGYGSDVLANPWGTQQLASSLSNYWALRSNEPVFLGIWNDLYKLAAYANLTMDGLNYVKDISETDAAYLTAQARFFRGWAYLRLAEMYGGVPIVDKYSEDLKYDYDRTTREETYSFAIEDLKAASDGLPQNPKAVGRVSKSVAQHFLSEAYLGRGIETGNSSDYSAAIAEADKVIAAHPLMTQRFGSRSENGSQPAGIPDNGVQRYLEEGNVYFDLFTAGNYSPNSGNTESLMILEQPSYDKKSVFGGEMNDFMITCGPSYRDMAWSDAYMDANLQAGAGSGPWKNNIDGDIYPGQTMGIHLLGSWGQIGTTDYSDYYVWEGEYAEDMRNEQINRWSPVVMDQKSPYYGQVVTREMLQEPGALARVSRKLTTPDLWGWDLEHCGNSDGVYVVQYGRDWYITRSAETYLLRAEAKLRSDDRQGAADDLNAIRSRAHASKLFSAGEVDMYTILDERARELSWEEQRWPTLLRIGGKGSNDVMHRQLERHSLGTEDTDAYKGQTFPEWTLFPIPYDVIDLNSGLQMEQNPGW